MSSGWVARRSGPPLHARCGGLIIAGHACGRHAACVSQWSRQGVAMDVQQWSRQACAANSGCDVTSASSLFSAKSVLTRPTQRSRSIRAAPYCSLQHGGAPQPTSLTNRCAAVSRRTGSAPADLLPQLEPRPEPAAVLLPPSRRRDCHSAAPPLHLVGVSIVMERRCQQKDSLVRGCSRRPGHAPAARCTATASGAHSSAHASR